MGYMEVVMIHHPRVERYTCEIEVCECWKLIVLNSEDCQASLPRGSGFLKQELKFQE